MIRKETVVAANRFGLGARPGDLEAIGDDSRGWLMGQITSPPPNPAEIAELDTCAKIYSAQAELRAQKQAARKNGAGQTPERNMLKELSRSINQIARDNHRQQVAARHRVSITTTLPFYEHLVHFWSNHFAVSVDKPNLLGLAGTLENEAIRPQVTGRFGDMLLAVEQHPAMLIYLDNQNSIGPNSRRAINAQRRGKRALGINENLGREILELHTLGVDGGYDQADVTALSMALSGWSVGNNNDSARGERSGAFYFRPATHEPSTVTIMGKKYKQAGFDQAGAVLADLARHPSTARHIGRKLATHFIADDPPSAAVANLEKAFLKSDGDLPTVYAALINTAAAWDPPLAKYKTPEQYLISAHRALDSVPNRPNRLDNMARQMGQRTYAPGSPAGWPERASDWDGADALIKRIEWATLMGAQARASTNANVIAEKILGPVLGAHTRAAIAPSESRAQALTLLLVSPEFLLR